MTLAFPRVLELQEKRGLVSGGTRGPVSKQGDGGRAAGLHRAEVEVSDAEG